MAERLWRQPKNADDTIGAVGVAGAEGLAEATTLKPWQQTQKGFELYLKEKIEDYSGVGGGWKHIRKLVKIDWHALSDGECREWIDRVIREPYY